MHRGVRKWGTDRQSVLTSIDISISGTQHNQSMPNSAETIIETHTFRPCMLRIPGVLPAEKKIDKIVDHVRPEKKNMSRIY